jgi:AraC-like DNA-binding protein
MDHHLSGSGGIGLARSCKGTADWIRRTDVIGGVELLEAWFQGPAYRPHRHDTYGIALTTRGVQTFDYRGASHVSLPGNVVVLHPDELHDGNPGSDAGFGYRLLYVDPALVFAAVRTLAGHRAVLPFVRQPVVTSPKLEAAIRASFRDDRDPLAIDDLIVRLAEGLLEADPGGARVRGPRRLDLAAVERARQYLDAAQDRIVRSAELERVSGLSRFDLASQFRLVVGTSPYRYSLKRRLAAARGRLEERRPVVEVALDTGFADQAHFTRQFTAAFGITPARYAVLSSRRSEVGGRK